MSDDDTSNVISVSFDRKVTQVRGVPGHCRHINVWVDEKTRALECQSCEKVIDPFDYMLRYAREEIHLHHWERKEKEVRERVTGLEEQEKKIKARIRGALKKDASEAVNKERLRIADARDKIRFKAGEIANLAKQMGDLLPGADDPKHTYSDDCVRSGCDCARRYGRNDPMATR